MPSKSLKMSRTKKINRKTVIMVKKAMTSSEVRFISGRYWEILEMECQMHVARPVGSGVSPSTGGGEVEVEMLSPKPPDSPNG